LQQRIVNGSRDETQRVLTPGHNCGTLASASHAALLVDAEAYFERLDWALRQAERSILIVGWDFDARIKLRPGRPDAPSIGPLLRSLVDARPDLHVDILVWSFAVVHAPGAPLPLILGEEWQSHPRITLHLDREHPVYASHHQKIVCIDDSLAFTGGIDLTVRRWDTCGHDEELAERRDPAGATYSPVHDVQMMLAGEAAHALSEIARRRWRAALQSVPAVPSPRKGFWPPTCTPDFVDIPVAVATTVPEWRGGPSVQEIARLTLDMLSAARREIYIEAQYFTARDVRDWMEKSLAARHGPEIVLVLKRFLPGVLERFVMGGNRDRVVRRLRRADHHNRLRVFYPVVPGKRGACEVAVHAKVLIIDNELIRIGSSNLNNRSTGLDTECDIAIEAHDDETRETIATLRSNLIAEHLGVQPDAVREAVRAERSLIRAIERLNRGPRGFRPLPERRFNGPLGSLVGTWLLDPSRPIGLPRGTSKGT
jgi:phosphatidylserine/phosphatidylglycerophosphate/cardiolipin synthase-like enzyme